MMKPIDIQLLYQLVEQAPDETIALEHGSEQVTFGQLREQVRLFAAYLSRDVQLQPRQRVALYEQKSVAQVSLLFAIWRAGGVVVMLNPTLKPAQVQHILNDSQASQLITSAARAEVLHTQGALPLTLQTIITTDKPWLAHELHSACSATWLQPLSAPVAAQQPSDLAALMYTSGSSGLPKGVMLSQRNLLLGAASVANYLALNGSDRVLALLPFSFDYGLNQLLSSWLVGARVVLHNFFLPAVVGRELAQASITVLAGVPPLWRQILPKLQASQLQSLRLLTNSGGALTTDITQQWQQLKPDLAIVAMYGLTEAFRSSYLPAEQLATKPNSVGRAIPHARLMVLDANLNPCAPQQTGELVHTGELVAMGYWQQECATAQRFIELPANLACYRHERAVRSGDLAYFDEEGDLFIVGRQDEQIKTSGYRVSPQEVEALALMLDGVLQAACFAVADTALGQAIVLAIETTSVSQTQLRQHYQKVAASYLWPQQICCYSQLPLNGNGKIDRPLVKKMVCHDINSSA